MSSTTGSKPKLLSLFSGCGGMDLGFKQAGYEVVWANDYNEFAGQTYKRNFGDHMFVGSITDVDISALPEADIITGGFPCQDFSMISKRGGIETERGNLYTYFVKAVSEVRPRIFVAENVKGLLTANKGDAIKRITEDFQSLGYTLNVKLYNFAHYGVAQLRERVLIVGVRNDVLFTYEPPKPTHDATNYFTSGQALRGVEVVEANNEHQNIKDKTRQLLALIPEGKNFAAIDPEHPLYVKGMISHVYKRLDRNKPSSTIIAGGGGGTWGYHYEENRPLTNRERARLFGYPDDFVFEGSITEVRRQIGNSVPPVAAKVIAEQLLPGFNAVSLPNRLVA
jgi:DNA (cytosine-5)-methyltransferase 1